MQPSEHPSKAAPDSRAVSIIWCAGLLIVLAAAAWHKLGLGHWRIGPHINTAVAEALAWRRGSFDVSPLTFETAAGNGERYNVVGLLVTLIASIGIPLSELFGGAEGEFAGWLFTCIVALPLPIVAFWSFREVGVTPPWAAVFSCHLIMGTALWLMLKMAGTNELYSICFVFSVTGLLIMGGDLLGRRRIWPAGIGLCIACWSRQITCLYAAPLLILAAIPLKPGSAPDANGSFPLGLNRLNRGFPLALVFVGLAAALPMSLNYAKFGNPFETGYISLWESHPEIWPQRDQFRLFSPRNMPPHLKAMHIAYPRLEIRHGRLFVDCTDVEGGSIWLVSPIFLGVILTARKWWADRRRVVLMVGSLVVMFAVNCYYSTASNHTGYYRYSIDFLPIWLLVIAPYILGPSGRVWTILALVWSAVYFNLLVR